MWSDWDSGTYFWRSNEAHTSRVTNSSNKQCDQAAKTIECAAWYWRDRVVSQVPVHGKRMMHEDIMQRIQIIEQYGQVAKSSEGVIGNRCEKVVSQEPVHDTLMKHTYITLWVRGTNSAIKLPRPAKAPLAIDVIQLPSRYLFTSLNWCTQTSRITNSSNKQCGQAAKSSEGASSNRCDLVDGQIPAHTLSWSR